MNREETIQRLCNLVTHVGAHHFHSAVSHDCFCARPDEPNRFQSVNEAIIEFIENAVRDAVGRY